jgi:hypothetical protein
MMKDSSSTVNDKTVVATSQLGWLAARADDDRAAIATSQCV